MAGLMPVEEMEEMMVRGDGGVCRPRPSHTKERRIYPLWSLISFSMLNPDWSTGGLEG